MTSPRRLIRTYQDLRAELKTLEARDAMDNLERLRTLKLEREENRRLLVLERIWMVRT